MKSWRSKFLYGILCASLLSSLAGIHPVYAASLVVNTNADTTITDSFCSLREAITNANNDVATYPDCAAGMGADTISFSANYTITLVGSQLPAITSTVIINGISAANTILQANTNPNTATYRVLAVTNTGNLTFNNLTVRNGRCNGSCPATLPTSGGGILNDGGTLTVTNSTLSNNSADFGGGILNLFGALTVTNSALSNNSVATTGGGILNYGTLTVTNSTLSANSAINSGGGIYHNTGTLTVTNSTLSNNSATLGGGIFNTGTLSVASSILTNNSANSFGGGIYNSNSLTVTDSTLSGNSASSGSGIYNNSGTTTIVTNSTFSGNDATVGGGIYNTSSSTITLTNSAFSDNSASEGGGINNEGGALTVTDSTFSRNRANAWGGGILNDGGSTATVTNSIFSNNSSIGGGFGGGGITNFAMLTVTNSTFSGNSANFGGGIENINGTLTIANSTFSGNSANNFGGGIYNNGTTTAMNSTFSGNSAINLGGGIYNGNTLTITNTIIANNTSGDDCTGTNAVTSINNLIEDPTSACGLTDGVNGNIIGSDPNLGLLANNGGLTQTFALLTSSPAIDNGDATTCSNPLVSGKDQRSVTRPQGIACDIGAYEFNDNTPQVVIVPTTYSVNEQATLLLHGTGISVGDINDDPLTVTITASDVNSQITGDTGSINAMIVSGNGTSTMVLTGTVAQLNDFFAGNSGSTLTYRLDDDTPVASVLLTITASDGSLSGSDTATINITAVNDAPVNTIPGAQTTNEDTALIFSTGNANQISVNDVDVASNNLEITLSITNGTLTLAGTTGLTFKLGDGTADSSMIFAGTQADINNALATLTFNPTPNYDGAAVLSITTSDLGNTGTGGTLTDTDNINITINAANDAPTVANAIPNQNATEDAAFNFQFAANTFADIDAGDTLTYSAQLAGGGALPAWLSFDAVTHTFSGTPANSDVGTVSIDVIADDGNGSTVTDTFDIVVANTNDAPTVANAIPNQTAIEAVVFNFQFAANTFADIDIGDTLTYSVQLAGGGVLPAWLSFDAVTRTFSGAPANGDVGTVSIDVIADDGNDGTVTDTFNIVVVNANNTPTVANPIPNQNATEDSAFNYQFPANTFADLDVGDTFTYSAQLAGGGALPAWLSFDAVTRTFSGTPANGDVGTVSIDVIANDGNGGTVTDTFNIVVANTNDAPTVANAIPDQNTTEGSAFNYQFPANTFADIDVGDTLTHSAQLAGGGALPAWLSFDAITRTFSGAPTIGDVGMVTIDVIADDGNGGIVTDTFNVTVTNNTVGPDVTINQAIAQVDPTETSPILFTVIFSEPVNTSTFTNTDITLGGTATGTLSVVITQIAPNDDTTFEVSVRGMTGPGTVTASIGAGTVQDVTGNSNTASVSIDNSVLYSPIYPTVASTNLNSLYTNLGPGTFTVTFSENVNNPIGNTDPEDVTNPANYLLVEDGVNNLFNTASCSGGLIADDTQSIVTSVAYNTTTYTATITLSTALPVGSYRLFVCGTTSIVDLTLNALNNGTDYIFNFIVITNATASSLPDTGFAPNRITSLAPQPANLAYTSMSDIWLEIPSINLKTDIVGVPQVDGSWDVDWLGNNIGWLNGTAFPTWEGNSVITGHVHNASGLPGPFANLKNLKYGDQIIVHLYGQKYIYEVQASRLAKPGTNTYAFQHLKDGSYLTLITCQSYDEKSDSYRYRRIIRAVLVDVQ